jgi:hypothetical protein
LSEWRIIHKYQNSFPLRKKTQILIFKFEEPYFGGIFSGVGYFSFAGWLFSGRKAFSEWLIFGGRG